MDAIKVRARLTATREGMLGKHWRQFAALEILDQDSPFVGIELALPLEPLKGLGLGDEVTITITPNPAAQPA